MLRANCVTCQTQDDVAVLAFADDEFNTTQYVMLQKGLKPSQEDRALGLDKLYMEVNSQGQSSHGGVETAQLESNRLLLTLDPKAAAKMSLGDTIEISFRVPREKLTEISDQLRFLLGPDNVQVKLHA